MSGTHISLSPGVNTQPSVSRWGANTDTDTDISMRSMAQEIGRLHKLCDKAKEDNEESWNAIREWIEEHKNDESFVITAAETAGENNTTPLHLACRNCPPVDIVEILLRIASHTVEMTDVFAWLPLHYACANGASEDVLRVLANAFPASKTSSDKRGRTPLHFALANTKQTFSPAIMAFLASTGATACRDENGMLPLHYACAYAVSGDALQVLTTAYPESTSVIDHKGRTPLHFAMGNAGRPSSPFVVDILLSHNQYVVDFADKEGQLPLNTLSVLAEKIKNPEKKKERLNAQKCLKLYLKAEPRATADFFLALQSLPEFLREHAVVSPHVRKVLDSKVSKRFPTMILMMDFYFLMLIVVFYRLAIYEGVKRRYGENKDRDKKDNPDTVTYQYLIILFLGGSYFLLREAVQMISLAFQGQFKDWVFDLTNILDVMFIVVVFFWSIVMQTDTFYGDDSEFFRVGTAFSTSIIWMSVLFFLKSIFIDFAVFVGGVLYVFRRLVTFLVALSVILVMFAQMFYTIYMETDYCKVTDKPWNVWCQFGTALLKVYTMLMGEVDETVFGGYVPALVIFMGFIFLVVILLSNVLIAIVTDSYGVIKNERSQVVFWNNRLDFVAEMHLISSGPWIRTMLSFLCCETYDGRIRVPTNMQDDMEAEENFGRGAWKGLVDVYHDRDQGFNVLSSEFWGVLLFRIIAAMLIPIWLVLGFFPTAGFLWPPQVREKLFVQKKPDDLFGASKNEQRLIQMKGLKTKVQKVRDSVNVMMKNQREDLNNMRYELAQMNAEMAKEMNHIKGLTSLLFESQLSAG